MYDITAIATEYRGVIFRSRTEAYAYEYFRNTYPKSAILYESRHYSLDGYTPDFIIGDYQRHLAIEVKPMLGYAEPERYIQWLETYSCMDDFIIWTPSVAMSIQYKNNPRYPVDEKIWKQAYNTVKRLMK